MAAYPAISTIRYPAGYRASHGCIQKRSNIRCILISHHGYICLIYHEIFALFVMRYLPYSSWRYLPYSSWRYLLLPSWRYLPSSQLSSVLWIRICIQELSGSGSLFRIRIRIHTCKYRRDSNEEKFL